MAPFFLSFFCLFFVFDFVFLVVAIYKNSQSSTTFVAGSLCPFICTIPCHKTLCESVVILVEQYHETLCASKTLCKVSSVSQNTVWKA